jgi:hypothetical protein
MSEPSSGLAVAIANLERRLAVVEAARSCGASVDAEEGTQRGTALLLERISGLEAAMSEQHRAVLELIGAVSARTAAAPAAATPEAGPRTAASPRTGTPPPGRLHTAQEDAATQTPPARAPLAPAAVPPVQQHAPRRQQGPSPLGRSSSADQALLLSHAAGADPLAAEASKLKPLRPRTAPATGTPPAGSSLPPPQQPAGGAARKARRGSPLPPVSSPATDAELRRRRAAFAGAPASSARSSAATAMAAAKRELARCEAQVAQASRAQR